MVRGNGGAPQQSQPASPPEQLRTEQGELVRNQSEVMIANYLHRNHVNYRYQAKPETRDFSTEINSRPEFYLTDYGVHVEYWGVMGLADGKTREQYQRMRRWKMAQYHRSNIKFISIYPSNLHNFDWIFRNKFRQVTGVELPKPQSAN